MFSNVNTLALSFQIIRLDWILLHKAKKDNQREIDYSQLYHLYCLHQAFTLWVMFHLIFNLRKWFSDLWLPVAFGHAYFIDFLYRSATAGGENTSLRIQQSSKYPFCSLLPSLRCGNIMDILTMLLDRTCYFLRVIHSTLCSTATEQPGLIRYYL